jgi:hypothetical protein
MTDLPPPDWFRAELKAADARLVSRSDSPAALGIPPSDARREYQVWVSRRLGLVLIELNPDGSATLWQPLAHANDNASAPAAAAKLRAHFADPPVDDTPTQDTTTLPMTILR